MFINNMQQILVYIVVALAALFLLRKFIFKVKHKPGCGNDDNCNCG